MADFLGQPPVHDECLPELPEQNVGRLEIAVQHALAVGIGHRVADRDEVAEQLPEGEAPFGRRLRLYPLFSKAGMPRAAGGPPR
jgi:hypothetical protein